MFSDRRTFAIRAAHVLAFSGDQDRIEDGAVVVRNGAITWVGAYRHLAEELARLEGATRADATTLVFDYGDATLLPGLIDTHTHLTLFADRRFYEAMAAEPDELMALVAVRNLERHLRSGVTTVRDNGSRNRVIFSVQEALRRGYFIGPRLLAAGRPITQTGGHFHWCNGVADGPEEVRREVRRLVGEGADHIKLMASGGGTVGSERDYPALTLPELRAAVTTAHALGRLTTAHCHATAAIENAIAAGVDCIEHAEFNLAAPLRRPRAMSGGGSRWDHEGMVYDPRITARIIERGINISFTPQAGGYELLLDLRADAAAGRLPAEMRLEMEALERKFAGRVEILSKLLAGGIESQLSISSDAGCFDGSFGRLHLGIGLALEAGMNVEAALRAVTVNAAAICGISEFVGSITTGLRGDLLVLPGDVLADVSALQSPVAVYQDGQLVSGGEPVGRRAAELADASAGAA
ncbi:amidohydrolase family protein [Streptomyces sp. NPDC056821]|uniref:amidohydrolase family protein n=1 Tax=unclassified Streptomyces TaxID=2593676 RepID=UPI0036BD2551